MDSEQEKLVSQQPSVISKMSCEVSELFQYKVKFGSENQIILQPNQLKMWQFCFKVD